MVTIKFDQAGIMPGVVDQSRSDGAATGAEVTVTTSEPGTVALLWAPVEDNGSAAATLHQATATTWKFSPNTDVYGTYRLQFTSDADPTQTTVRVFAIPTPNLGLRIPALNEKGNPNASLLTASPSMVSDSEFNEPEESGPFTQGNYGGWYSSLAKLFQAVDAFVETAGGTIESIASTTPTGLTVTHPSGPDTQLTLNFGSSAGQIADGAALATAQTDIDALESSVASISSTVSGHTSSISTLNTTVSGHTTSISTLNTTVSGHTTSISANTANISSVSATLTAHTGNTSNPHSTTKAQVGLGNVTDDVQIKADFSGYSAQTGAPAATDKFVINRASDGAVRTVAASFITNKPATSFAWSSNAATLDISTAQHWAASGTMGGNSTLTLINGADGMRGSIYVKQDATGSRTLTFTVSGRTILRDANSLDDNPESAASSITLYEYEYVTVNATAYIRITKVFCA